MLFVLRIKSWKISASAVKICFPRLSADLGLAQPHNCRARFMKLHKKKGRAKYEFNRPARLTSVPQNLPFMSQKKKNLQCERDTLSIWDRSRMLK
jgi:hypothetical protein